MPSKIADDPSAPPASINPYDILAISSEATQDQVKKAYRKAALKNHPDKVTGEKARAEAHENFQRVAFAYAILSEPGRRARYDSTGSTSEAVELEDGSFDWGAFYREQFEEITLDMVDKFGEKYKGSAEERRSIIEYYNKYEGNMNMIYESVLVSNVLEDDERFRSILDEAIAKGEIEGFDKYVNESDASKDKRVKKAQREAREVEEMQSQMDKRQNQREEKEMAKKNAKAGKGNGNVDDLAALIQNKHKARSGGSFLDKLEAKYTTNKKKSKRAAPDDKPSEEAFQAARAKLDSTKQPKAASDQSGEGTRRSKRSKV